MLRVPELLVLVPVSRHGQPQEDACLAYQGR